MLYLRNADDALALKARVGDATDMVVVGGGFIGLEAASSLQKMGKNVTVLEFGPRLVGRAVGEETAEYFLEAHRSRGLDIRLNTSAARFPPAAGGAGAVAAVELQDGTVLPAQIVLIGIGVIPNTQLAEQLGLPWTTAWWWTVSRWPRTAPPWPWGLRQHAQPGPRLGAG